MRILANVRGTFLEPVGNFGVRDAVSFLQLQAQVSEEASVLQQMYKVLREGGVIRVIASPNRTNIHCEFANDPKSEEPGVATDSRAEIPSEPWTPVPPVPQSPEVEAVTPQLTRENALTIPGEHQHIYSTARRCVYDPEGVWLGCECGEWEYFPRLTVVDGHVDIARDSKKPN